MTLNCRTTLYCISETSFAAHRGNLKASRPILSAAEMLPRNSILKLYKVSADIRAVLWLQKQWVG